MPAAIVTEIARQEQNERYYEQKHIHDSFLCPKESSKQNGKGGHYDPRLCQWRIRTVQLEAGHRAAVVGYDESKDDRHDESRTRVQRAARRHSDESAHPLSGNREIRSLRNGGKSPQRLLRDNCPSANAVGDVSQAQRRRAEIGRYQQECSHLSQIRPLLPKGGRVHSNEVSGQRRRTERSNAFVSRELRTILAGR